MVLQDGRRCIKETIAFSLSRSFLFAFLGHFRLNMRLSLSTRIFVGHAVVLLAFGAVSIFSLAALRRNQIESRLDGEGYLTLTQMASSIQTFQKNQAEDAARLREESNPLNRRALVRLSRMYFPGLMAEKLAVGQATLAKMEEFAPSQETAFIVDLKHRFEDLSARYEEYAKASEDVFRLLESTAVDSDATDLQIERAKTLENALSSNIRLLQGALEIHIRDRVQVSQARERRTGILIIGLSLAAIAIGLLATALAARSLRPIRLLIDGASRVGRGDYSANLGLSGDDEVSVLAREFDSMASALAEREAQLRKQQEALLRAERLAAVGRISASVAHEVRNPLSSMGLNLEMLSDQLKPENFVVAAEAKEAQQLLDNVTKEIDRLTEVTEEYLSMARLPEPALKKENLSVLVESVLNFSTAQLQHDKISVTHQFASAHSELLADQNQLRQVLVNLLKNSREAMPSGGALTLSVSRVGSRIELRWTDTGVGIAERDRPQIFEPFFTTKRGGTGLGLSLSRQIVELHGGTIGIEPGAGPGTTFVLSFPAV